jgi:hypothetical protein
MPVFDKTKSKIKMVILTKGNTPNKVWYSPINQNKRKSELVIRSMLKRVEKQAFFNQINVIQFYENNQIISSIKY